MRAALDRAFPSQYPRTRWPPAAWLAIGGLLLLTATTLLSRDLSNLGLNLLLLGSFLSAPAIGRGDPDAIWYVVVLVFAAWMLAVNTFASAPDGLDHWKHTREHLRFCAFLLCGWWLGGVERNAAVLVAVALGGLVAVVLTLGAGDWALLGQGSRVSFGLRNEQHSALLFGTLILAVVCLAPRAFSRRARGDRWRWPRILLWTNLVVVSLVLVIASQTRQVWVGLLAAGVAILWLSLHNRLGQRIKRRAALLALAGLLALATALPTLMPATLDALWTRTATELAGVRALIADQGEGVDQNSLAIRLVLWQLGLSAIAERPWTGHGAAYGRAVIAGSELPDGIRDHIGHLHNSYLELWVAYGVAGPTVFAVLLLALARRTAHAWQRGWLAADLAVFGIAWIAFFATVNLFESYVSYRSGHLLMLLVGGILYSLAIPGRRAEARARTGGSLGQLRDATAAQRAGEPPAISPHRSD